MRVARWLLVAVVVVGAEAGAGPAASGAGGADREAYCRRVCGPVVTRCVENLRGMFGDMQEHCEHVTVEKCVREGPEECEKAGPGLASPPPSVPPES